MGRVSWRDGRGLLLAAVFTTSPLLAATLFMDHASKDGPVGLPAYLLPAAIGLSAAVVASGAAVAVGRGSPDRLGLHAGFGCLASLALVVSFCGWWGEGWLRFAGQFRG